MPAVPHTHTQTRTYTPGQLYVESEQLRGLRFKNISKCDASVLYLRKCLAQTQRYKYIYLYISMWVCVCVKCAVFCIAWRNTYLAANSFCQFHVRNYKLRGNIPFGSSSSHSPPPPSVTWYNCLTAQNAEAATQPQSLVAHRLFLMALAREIPTANNCSLRFLLLLLLRGNGIQNFCFKSPAMIYEHKQLYIIFLSNAKLLGNSKLLRESTRKHTMIRGIEILHLRQYQAVFLSLILPVKLQALISLIKSS